MSFIPRLENAGMDAWLVRLFEHIDEANIDWIQALARQCEKSFAGQLIDLVPSYTTLLVHYDCLQLDADQAREKLWALLGQLQLDASPTQQQLHELPIWYDPQVGPDLPRLEQLTGLDWQQLVALHTQSSYRVFALGFAPGFAFMGRLPERLQQPRLTTPRQQVPANSLGIAEQQTAIYPNASPGGWNLIGRGCTQLFDPQRQPPSLLQVGDAVRFQPVSKAEFLRLGGNTEEIPL
ncbi:5-oxoprolinase subunit PxpB [Marinospirillum sp.]|uniref:5-oxoprolinase subunit PxpB n=1 Tax=Marinospirillum sp. TaxID=2183934 RepID=UPI00384B8023